MDHRKEIDLIFKKFLNNTCSPEEFEILKRYLERPEAESNIKRLMDEEAEFIRKYQFSKGKGKDENVVLLNKIIQAIGPGKAVRAPRRKTCRSVKRSWYFAAMILIASVMGLWLMYTINNLQDQEVNWFEKVTLAGQKATITLVDGSTVLLNSESKLTYPEVFKDRREVILEGEAFFVIARDDEKPFSIKSGKLITTVLGTSFNIRAFQDENIEVTVASGRVKISQDKKRMELPDDRGQGLILTPNQQAVYNISGDYLGKEEVDAGSYLAWREGIIKLDNVNFDEVVKVLERWYGIKIVLENERISNCVLIGGEFQHQSLHQVLKTVELVLGVTYEFTDGMVVIRGEGCPSKRKRK